MKKLDAGNNPTDAEDNDQCLFVLTFSEKTKETGLNFLKKVQQCYKRWSENVKYDIKNMNIKMKKWELN